MATSHVPAVITKLRDQLKAREALTDVQIASGYLEDDSYRESIQLIGIRRSNQEWAALGNRKREEQFNIVGWIWVYRPGKGEALITECRARAYEFLAEIEDQLREDPKIEGLVLVSELVDYEHSDGRNPDGRWCQIDFAVGVRVHLPRG